MLSSLASVSTQPTMNLELLDPFGRQVPDRIDATLVLPSQTHSGAATACAFNRRGTYLAVGYADGSVAIYSTLTRTLMALYLGVCSASSSRGGGVGHISWSRKSRQLLVGAVGDTQIHLIDTTHPAGSELASERLLYLASSKSSKEDADAGGGGRGDAQERTAVDAGSLPLEASIQESGVIQPQHAYYHTKSTSFRDMENHNVVHVREYRQIGSRDTIPQSYKEPKQFPAVTVPLPGHLEHTLQLHPDGRHGLAICDGSLYLMRVEPESFCEAHDGDFHWTPLDTQDLDTQEQPSSGIACATFGSDDSSIYAVRSNDILFFRNAVSVSAAGKPAARPVHFAIECADPWHLLRHRSRLLLNGGDGVLRLYDTTQLNSSGNINMPTVQFQDSVTKTTFADAALSGDGEHVVAVVNGGTSYELYIWNALSGVLVDKLNSISRVSTVQWHPVRSFVVGACEDGIVDVWGPCINWTAFAPDFQALPENVEYIEREDEYDLDETTKAPLCTKPIAVVEDTSVDVLGVDPVPVFASDSEDEDEVFEFETRVKNVFVAKGEGKKGRYQNAMDD